MEHALTVIQVPPTPGYQSTHRQIYKEDDI